MKAGKYIILPIEKREITYNKKIVADRIIKISRHQTFVVCEGFVVLLFCQVSLMTPRLCSFGGIFKMML